MIISRNIQTAARRAGLADSGCVVTIGNFDGVHLGHQAMLQAAKIQAQTRKIPLLVMSFDPHADVYFSAEAAPSRLMSFAERVIALKNHGVDVVCIVAFDKTLANMPHAIFVQKVLLSQLNAKCVLIGDDFHYGKGRKGDVSSLRDAAQKYSFDLQTMESVMKAGLRVSSTAIRQALSNGELNAATALLGRKYSIIGRVIHGDARGRTWGFPTLNLPMRYRRALKGVFAVTVSGLDVKVYQGVANLGKRPTVDGLKTLLEIHLFEYQGEAYGSRVCVEFHAQLRQEQKFESFDALKAQIRQDTINAKRYFTGSDICPMGEVD